VAGRGAPRQPLTPPRLVAFLAAALGASVLAAAAHVAWISRHPASPEAEMEASLSRVQDRLRTLVDAVQDAGLRAAALPQSGAALSGGAASQAAAFAGLDELAAGLREQPALAIRTTDGVPVAWAGRASLLPDLEPPAAPEVIVLHGAVTSTLVARVPIRGPDGSLRGIATAERALAVRRRIQNAYIGDFDLLAIDASVQVAYVDVKTAARTTLPATAGPHRDAVLSSPQGRPLALVRVSPPRPDTRRETVARAYRRACAALALALCVALASILPRPGPAARLALAAIAGRAILLGAGPPWPAPGHELLTPEAYASSWLGWGLLASPLDLLLTTLALLGVALAAAGVLLSRAAPAPRLLRLVVALPTSVACVAGLYAFLGDAAHNSSLELHAIRIQPESAPLAVVQLGLLLAVLAAGTLVLAGLAWAGALRLPERSRPLGAGRAALAGLAAVAVAGLLLQPTLRALATAALRTQVSTDYAAAVLRQPSWRSHALRETQRRLDRLQVLEETLPSPQGAVLEELAFALWSSTDLAAFGFSSAVEVQDTTGAVVSRFALNLPSLPGAEASLPTSEDWVTERETLRLGSAERHALHGRKLLRYHDEVHGGLHVYVGEDYWNLPFLIGRDPYSVLFRTASRTAGREPTVHLVAWRGGEVTFSSLPRPPVLPTNPPRDGWAAVVVDDRPHQGWFFTDGAHVFALLHPSPGWPRRVADTVEAVVAFVVAGALLLLGVLLVRTVLGLRELSARGIAAAVQKRFALRLFVAFTVAAVLPVAVLQLVLRGFLVERLRVESQEQALERAAVARKVVQDYAIARQAGESAVSDAVLVVVASFIENDLDLFQAGRLLASSKRELYASGLLPERAPGAVHRAIALEGQPWVLRRETIGAFSYLVVSVPVVLDDDDGILSIPLPLPQRELEATVEDLSRTVRLASVVFFALAAALAHSMARRISGPIHDLTAAAHQVAQGDLRARVAVTSRDELSDLVAAFNRMAEDLDRQRRDLERSNRLAAWAEMARQVAHEVKNPLTPIQLSTEHLRRVWERGSPDFAATLEVCTQTILKQVRTLRGMVTEFSAFARPPAPVLERQDLGRIVEDALRAYRGALPEHVELEVETAPALPPVHADRRLLERAVVNLVENALQAIGGQGRVRVEVRGGDGKVEVLVIDDGPGMDADIQARVFEPFFSTKTGGSGLGLALVKKIAEDHGGGVSLESGPAGTQIGIWLPAA
jgi:signal transduction histidine kinase